MGVFIINKRMEMQSEEEGSHKLAEDIGSEKSCMSKDSGEGGSKGSSEGSGEKVVVKEQVKAVVGDLESVLGELKTVVGDLRVLVNQIDVVTSRIDEEYGAEEDECIEIYKGGICKNIEIKKAVEMRADKRRRSASALETGTPKREVPAYVRHSLSQAFEVQNKDWRCQNPLNFSSKVCDSPRRNVCNSAVMHKNDEHFCQAHSVAGTKAYDALSTPKKDDIIICTPGSQCHKREHGHGTPKHMTPKKADLAIYENVPITKCKTPSKSGSNNSRSPRTSSSSKGHSPRTSNSSGIGNSAESVNGNTYIIKKEKQRKYQRSPLKRSEMVDSTTQVDLNIKSHNYHPHSQKSQKEKPLCVRDVGLGEKQGGKHGTALKLDSNNHLRCTPCSASPDSDYCGVYERELDLKLELIFEDDFDDCDERRTLDLQSYPGYGSTYDRERVSRWAAYTLVNIGSMPMSDDQLTATPSETSSDILNDNVFLTTAAELHQQRSTKPWSSVFERYYKHGLESPDTG